MNMRMAIPLDFVPSDPEELAACLADPQWRVGSGFLYKIMIKEDDNDDGTVIPFKPNRAQRRLVSRLWHRNIILKARQLGFTTLVAILWLDHALFNDNQRCGIIAQDREAAEVIFRDKVKLAYENMPESLRQAMPLKRDSASELLFGHNNSSIRVATSMRSGTIHRLHISEFGKICAKFPDKAKEVMTGSLPAVPLSGITIIESTAEGQDGDFYTMTERARALDEQGKELTERDYRFHFFPWWQEDAYRITSNSVVITEKDREYFAEVEALIKQPLDQEQRNWYVATRDADFAGDPEKMWQEYPSYPEEAFKVSTEGTYYAKQLAASRLGGRIGFFPHVEGIPVNSFWDIGNSDGTGVWLHQRIGGENRFIRYIEGWGEGYSYFTNKMRLLGYEWAKHKLPHDGDHAHQQYAGPVRPIDELEKSELGGVWEIVPRVNDIQHGIEAVRKVFGQCTFHEPDTKEGLIHLARYKKSWNTRGGCWSQTPFKDIHTECADAFRQFAQGYEAPRITQKKQPRKGNWRTA
ncbi:terminase [Polaromonas sp.]|uniref:terminase n=1 Tax=Polaromonas sp. TaxID=1869339 RepID=UPI00326313C0